MGHTLIKRFSLVINFLLLYCALCFSQERVTELLGQGNGQRFILQEQEGTNYILTVKPNDILTVYVENQGEISQLYERTYIGLHNTNKFQTTKSHLLIPNPDGLLAYNFIENKEFFYPYPEELNKSQWVPRSDKREEVFVILSSTDGYERQTMLVNLEEYTFDILTDESWYLNISDQYIHEREDFGDIESHYVIDRSTGNKHLMYNGSTLYGGDSAFNDHGFAFKSNDDKAVIFFDNQLQSLDTLMKLPEDFSDVTVCEMTSYHVVFVETDWDVSDVYLFDSTQQLIGQYTAFEAPNSVYPEIIGNKIFGNRHGFFTLDISTGVSTKHNISFNDYIIYDDNKLLSDHGDVIKILNLESNLLLSASGLQTEGSTSSLTHLVVGTDSLLLNFDSQFDNTTSLYLLKNLSLQPSDLLNNISNGLSFLTRMQVQNDLLALVDDQIHQIDGNAVSQVNDGEIIPTYFGQSSKLIFNDEICWLQALNNETELNCMREGLLSKYGPLPHSDLSFDNSSIRNYIKSGDFIYYVLNEPGALNSTLYKFNLISSELISLGVLDLLASEKIRYVDDIIYYHINDTLFADKEGLVINSYPIVFEGVFENIVSFKGDHYLFNENGVYNLSSGEAQLIYTERVNSVNIFGEYLFFISDDQQFTIYDGQNFHDELLDSPYFTIAQLNDEYLVLYNYEDPEDNQTFIFNMESLELRAFDEEFNDKRLDGTFQVGAHKLLVASKRTSISTSIAEVYLYDGDFESFQLLEQFEHNGFYTNFDYKKSIHGSLIYIASKIYTIDDNAQFSQMETIVGDFRNVGLTEVNNYFYFLAFDPILGRQVFRINSNSILSDGVKTHLEPELLVYPNPASNHVIIELQKSTQSFQIYNQLGNLVMESNKMESKINQIDISNLTSGVFTIKVVIDNKIHSKQLVKM